MIQLSDARKALGKYVTGPVVKLLAKTPITPNGVSFIGFLLTTGGAVLIATEHLVAAGVVVIVASFFDMLDGGLARLTNKVTSFGAILDSTLDRLAEAALFLGVIFLFGSTRSTAEVTLAAVALVGSYMVSYIRARAEGKGIDCEVGILTRPERVIILVLGLLLSSYYYSLVIALAIIAVLSYITAGQRLFHAWRKTRGT